MLVISVVVLDASIHCSLNTIQQFTDKGGEGGVISFYLRFHVTFNIFDIR